MSNLPIFFNYKDENTDNGYETIQDFFFSWTLRCAVKNSEFPTIINNYAKNILLNLIFDDIPKNTDITSVKTKRQWKLIDLLVEVEININNITKKYILNIENKWYTSVRDGQLEKSKKSIIERYSDEKYELVNLIILPDYENLDNNLKDIAEKLNYKIKIIQDLKEKSGMNIKTNNYLFDEYWFKFYK